VQAVVDSSSQAAGADTTVMTHCYDGVVIFKGGMSEALQL
jgi:hypothetical protein